MSQPTSQLNNVPPDLHTGSTIRTFTGRYFDILDLKPEMVHIEDIAHALSMNCRFGGHIPVFYSVAQHSISVAEMVPKEHRLEALLHDASEAYIHDMPKPFKRHMYEYQYHEARIEKLIAEVFGLKYPWHESIKEADKLQLEFEWQAFVVEKPNTWYPMTPAEAKERFLALYHKLTNHNGHPTK